MAMIDVVKKAKKQLGELTGHDVESVFALERSAEGWSARIELVEVARTPNTQDLLGMYEVQLDEHGDLESFDRVGMRVRGTPEQAEEA